MFRSSGSFDKLLDKATSHLLLDPDWSSILQVCDSIRQEDVRPKYAAAAIKKKLFSPIPQVTFLALHVLESCVKNCGPPVHQEVTSKVFMDDLVTLLKNTSSENVKGKILELIQVWSHVFRNESNCNAVQESMKLLKAEGYQFPVLKESDAMFLSERAPEWVEGSCCHRCRVQFTLLQRKHHCRNCGQIFCQKCSSRSLPIPQFGLEKEVRVCETCWEKLNKNADNLKQKLSGVNIDQSSQNKSGNEVTIEELIKEEERQLALALAQSESESLEKEKKKSFQPDGFFSNAAASHLQVDSTTSANMYPNHELNKYLDRSIWEQKQQKSDFTSQMKTNSVPSAPPIENRKDEDSAIKNLEDHINENDVEDYISQLRTTLEIFVNRMKSNSSRNRPLANDTYVQSLFMNITNMHSQLLAYIKNQDERRVEFERLQDKLAQVKDARAALNALREEHEERRRKEAEEAERQRQIQMAQKLEIMRKKKQEYLQYQHQLAIQKMQEQEREMHFRQEQQKHQQYTQGSFPVPPEVYNQANHPYLPPPHYAINQTGTMHSSSAHGSYIPYGIPPPPTTNMTLQQPYPHNEFHSFHIQGVAQAHQGAMHSQIPTSSDNVSVQHPVQSSLGSFPVGPLQAPNGNMNSTSMGQELQNPPVEHLISFQ